MIFIPEGRYSIGTNDNFGFAEDLEKPKIDLYHSAFFIDQTTVTNEEFEKFCSDTNYVTDAEKYGWSFVFHYFVDDDNKKKSNSIKSMPWWYAVYGADWRHPEGPGSTIEERMDHPVVHVSRNDAIAYCKWSEKRLPTEAEWEIAARGGTQFEHYPWGEDLLVNGEYQCNIWQGQFPEKNNLNDGYANTAPVKTYKPNGFGCYQMIGNVWEWCLNPAKIPLFSFEKYSNEYFYAVYWQPDDHLYATKGGSFLCHASYCKRYRITARNSNTGNSSSNNIGFRCVK